MVVAGCGSEGRQKVGMANVVVEVKSGCSGGGGNGGAGMAEKVVVGVVVVVVKGGVVGEL